MKTNSNLYLFCCCAIVLATPAPIQAAAVLEPAAQGSHVWQVGKRSASQTEWISVKLTTNLFSGRVTSTTNSYTELAASLNRWDHQGRWQPSNPAFTLTEQGVEATNSAHTLRLAGNINSIGAIEVRRGATVIEAHPICLGYFDPTDGSSVIFATVTNAGGWLTASNEVTYSNCFNGVWASLVYKNSRAGVEQFLLLHERPPTPEAVGLSPASRLEMFTEFDGNTPVPEKADRVLTREMDPVKRQAMAEPDFTDSTLTFEALRMLPGKAFLRGAHSSAQGLYVPPEGTRVGKRFEIIQGRKILIEAVEHSRIHSLLQSLPAAVTNASIKRPTSIFQLQAIMAARSLPADRAAKSSGVKIQSAKLTPSDAPQSSAMAKTFPPQNNSFSPVFVLDFTLISTGDLLTNYTFRGDTTYRVSGDVYFYGLTTFSGGTVVKYDTNANTTLEIHGPVQCNTDPYRPALFTSVYDNSVGVIIDTNQPPTKYVQALAVAYSGVQLKHLRISYASWAVHTWDVHLSHSQILHSDVAIFMEDDGTPCQVDNVLLVDVGRAFWGWRYALDATHVTIDRCGILAGDYFYGDPFEESYYSVAFTNCLLVGITNMGIQTNIYDHTEWPASAAAAFQTVGASSYYLAPNSPYRNAGTTDIAPALLGELKSMTTYPPIVITNVYITADTTLGPQAQRDTDTPDLGFHFSPLDFAFGGNIISNAALTLQPGTTLATYGGNSYVLALQEGAQIISEGSPTNLNRIVRYNTVQEQSVTNWSSSYVGASIMAPFSNPGAASTTRFRFTDFSMPAGNSCHFQGTAYGNATNTFTDCQFHGGSFQFNLPAVLVTNCLFERVGISLDDSSGPLTAIFRNCLFYGGSLSIYCENGGWEFKDSLFDQTALTQAGEVTNDHNAYTAGVTNLTPTNATSDVFLPVSNFAYQTNLLGRFYLPTNSILLDAGSLTNAGLIGLYHHTSTTNQVRETNSVLNIGFHYIAVTSSGLPLDTDGEGLADYLEDSDGDGVTDPTESNIASTDTDGDGVNDLIEFLQGRNSRAGAVADTNSIVNLRVYSPLKQ